MGAVMPSLWGCCEDEVMFVKKPRALVGTEWMVYYCGVREQSELVGMGSPVMSVSP